MAKNVSRLQRIREGFRSLLDERMFRSPGEPTRLYKFIHFWVLVGKSFVRNRCPIRASALSFSTLLALIPMLAVAISVTSSLLKREGEEQIYAFIDKMVSTLVPPASVTNAPPAPAGPGTNAPSATGSTNVEQPQVTLPDAGGPDTNLASSAAVASGETNAPGTAASEMRIEDAQKKAARSIHGFIRNIRSGTIGVTGMVLLVFVAIRMLASIEATFNDIWGVTRGRSWLASTVIYWTAITLGPLLLAGAVALAGGRYFEATRKILIQMPFIGAFVFKLLPLLVLWLSFALLYKAMPNTKVRFSAAFVGAIVGATAWHVNNLFGFLYVSRVVSNSKMYGGLFLVPVFMAGMYLSWLILLFGAQVAYAFQNRQLYLQEKLAENVNQRGREFVAFRLMTCIGQRFVRGLPPPTIQEMSGELGIPSRLAQQVLQTLIAAHLVIEVSGMEPAYTPARPLENINAHHVLMAMRATQGQELITRDEPVREEVYGEFARIQEAEKQVASSLSMLALVNRAQARLELAPPPPDEAEIKLKHALVPPAEPVDRSEPIESPATHSAEETARVAPSAPPVGPDADSPTVPTAAETARTREPEPPPPPVVQPTSETERDFPL